MKMTMILGGAFALVLGLGACLQTDPGCEFADSCGEVDELGRATERRKCINLCQETAPPDLVSSNRAACRLDPCDTHGRSLKHS